MSPERRSVVITGIGPVTACGIGVEGLLAGLRSRRSPVAPVTRFDSSPFRSHMAAEAAIGSLTLRDGWIPPTLNPEEPGEACDLDWVTGAGRDGSYRAVVSDSVGFGGINAVILLAAPSELH